MEKLDAQKRIQELIEYLNYHQDLYDAGTPQISDKEWDDAYVELKLLEDQFPSIEVTNSPTKKIRYEVVTELKKVKHEYQPMLSLDKTKDIEEVKQFIKDKDWIAMLKLDGLTCRLTYEGGRLVRAETRGNGIEGEDITHNARVLPSIPQLIYYTDTLIVDGEIICDLNTFKQFENNYANARNFAAGSIRLLDSNESAKRGLTFVAWDVITGYQDIDTALNKKLATLIDYGFTVVPFSILSFETVIEDLQECNRKYCNYPIDGIVFKYNKNGDYQAAGRTEHHFCGGLAYKFYDEEYETELLDIEWTMGRTGVLTPVAIYKDVEIDGAICNRANLHNVNIMHEILGDYPLKGQQIWVVKQNQIIPQVVRANKEQDLDRAFIIPIPTICPYCLGTASVQVSASGTEELFCDNPECSSKLINKLDHFAGKRGLDIKGLSKATLEKLIEWGWVDSFKSLFHLEDYKIEWIKKPGFGVKSVDRILNAIEEARHCSLEAFLSAIGIPLIGKTYARQLATIFSTYNDFRIAIIAGFNFTTIEGFGPTMHEAIVNFNYYEADRMHDMKLIEINSNNNADTPSINTSLKGLTFVVTGKLQLYKNREALKNDIEQYGGRVVESISKNTNYLINNDIESTSAKNKKAKELGIPIISEQMFAEMIEK